MTNKVLEKQNNRESISKSIGTWWLNGGLWWFHMVSWDLSGISGKRLRHELKRSTIFSMGKPTIKVPCSIAE